MTHSPGGGGGGGGGGGQPLVVSLNCLDDPSLEQELLAGVAGVEHVSLSAVTSGRIEVAAAVLLPSLAFLPRAAQRRLWPWQLLLCLGSPDRAADAAAAADLGLRLVHVDANRAEEVADTVMALFLGLLRRTHLLSRHVSSAPASSSRCAAACGAAMASCLASSVGPPPRAASPIATGVGQLAPVPAAFSAGRQAAPVAVLTGFFLAGVRGP